MIAEGAVEPLAVVKHFDPFKDGGTGLRPCGELQSLLVFFAPLIFAGKSSRSTLMNWIF